MAKIEINAESFVKTGVNDRGHEVGTVEVNGKPHKAVKTPYAICLHGFIGRYRTSANPWAACVWMTERGLYVSFGRDDRSGRFNKRDAISYEPALYDTLTNQAYWTAV